MQIPRNCSSWFCFSGSGWDHKAELFNISGDFDAGTYNFIFRNTDLSRVKLNLLE